MMIKLLLALIVTTTPVFAGPFFKTKLSNGQTLEKNTQGYTFNRNGTTLSTTNGQISVGLNTNGSLLFSSRKLQLNGDSLSPGNSKYYGTNGSGVKGWHVITGGSSESNGGTLGSINNGNYAIQIANGTGYYTTLTLNGNLQSWGNKVIPSGTVVGTSDVQTLTAKTISGPIITTAISTNTSLQGPVLINGVNLSINTLGQGSILFTKQANILSGLDNGASSNHKVLKVNGNTLAWESITAGGSSEWTDNGSNLYPNELGDSVSIGKNFNNGKLNLNGDIAFKSMSTPTLDMMGDYPRVYVKSSTGNLTFLKWDGMSQTEISLIPSGTSVTSGGSSTDNHVPVWVGSGGNSLEDSPVVIDPTMGDITGVGSLAIGGGMGTPLAVSTNALLVDSGGNVGISTTSPDHRLDVTGTSEFSDQIDIANNKYISWSDGMSYVNLIGLNSSNNLIIKNNSGMSSNGNILFQPMASAEESLRLSAGGNIGVHDNSPDFLLDVNGTLGATSINKVTITAPASSATLTLATGSSLITSGANPITFTSTGTTNVTLPTTGTLATTSNKLSAFASTTSSELAGVISDETGTGLLVLATTPTLTTPVIGAATGTSLVATGKIIAGTNINGVTLNVTNAAIGNGGYFLSVKNLSNGGASEAFDFTKANKFIMALNASSCAITAGTDPSGATTTQIMLAQRAGSQTVTWTACTSASGFCWPGGTAPTLTTTANAIDIISCLYNPTKDRYYCNSSADFK